MDMPHLDSSCYHHYTSNISSHPPAPMLKHLPNSLTFLRCLASPILALMIVHGETAANGEAWVAASLALFIAVATSDWLDGWTARRLGATSRLGAVLDPIADKLLIASCLLALVAVGRAIFIPALLILLREIFIAGLRQYISETKHKPHLQVTPLAKAKTWLQAIAIASGIAYPLMASWEYGLMLMLGCFYLALAVTLVTGLDYTMKAIRHAK